MTFLSECAGWRVPGRFGIDRLPDAAPQKPKNRLCWEFELISPSSSDAKCGQSLVGVILPSRTHAGILLSLSVVEEIEEADFRRHRCLAEFG